MGLCAAESAVVTLEWTGHKHALISNGCKNYIYGYKEIEAQKQKGTLRIVIFREMKLKLVVLTVSPVFCTEWA